MHTRHPIILASLLLCICAPVWAMGPVATPSDALPVGQRLGSPPAALKAFGDPTDYQAAALAGADYLVGMQADVTEDNAGNGSPDADPEDAGWDWVSTIFEHSANASELNLYGVTALGLLHAYMIDPDPAYFTAMEDAADHIVAVGPTVIRSASDVIFLVKYADLSGVSNPGDYRDAAETIWLWQRGRPEHAGTATSFAQWLRDVRGVTQGYPNGIVAWDLGGWAEAVALLDGALPGFGYDADADAIAEVMWEDSFNANPGHFEPNGDNKGFTTDYSDIRYWWYPLGVSGLIQAFATTGAHTAELPGLQTLLLQCQYADGAFSFQYGATNLIDDRDWQGTAYAIMALYGYLPHTTTTMAALRNAATWTASTQDVVSGGFVYGNGDHYPEVGSENTCALAMGWLAAGAALTADLGDLGPINCSETETVTFRYTPGDATPALRGFDLTIDASAALTFGVSDVTNLNPFAGLGVPYFDTIDNGDGTITISGAVLGPTTGLLIEKNLFSITFHAVASGTGTIDIISYRLRDLNNVPIFADVNGASVVVDCDAPDPVSDISVAPGHEKLKVDWTDSASGDVVAYEVWLGLWTDGNVGVSAYPEYDDIAAYNPAARPASRAAAAASGGVWVLGDTYAVGVDTKPFVVAWVPRGIYTVEVFALDSAGNYSAVAPDGNDLATNYWLGDVPPYVDGYVDVADINVLGACFGTVHGDLLYDNDCDVGPTDDMSRLGLPTTDNVIDFEDLMIFALNFTFVTPTNKLPAGDLGQPTGAVPLAWRQVDDVTWTLALTAPCPALKGLRLRIELPDGMTAALRPGALLDSRNAPYFLQNIEGHGLDANLALLGDGQGFTGAGELMRVTLSGPAAADRLASPRITARSGANQDLGAALGETPTTTPLVFRLFPNNPNPFNPSTKVRFALPAAAQARLVVYGLDGRKVVTLVDAALGAGAHEAVWDGRDSSGRQVASGAYVCRLDAGTFSQTIKMVLTK